MEPNKFENHIKEKLKNRKIRPSAGAWGKIQDRLNTSEKPKNNRVLWYSIAASFVGLLMVSALFFQSNNNDLDSDIQIVDTKKEESNGVRKELPTESEENSNRSVEDPTQKKLAVEENSDPELIRLKKEAVQQYGITEKNENTLVATEETEYRELKLNNLIEDSEERIDLKIAKVLAQVDLLEQNDETVTDAEIDSLLRAAQRELFIENMYKSGGSVDAMALLNEVEDELDQSFRNQIFEKLKSGFVKVRTAVADRNN